MSCPDCSGPMVKVRKGRGIRKCPRCGILWIPKRRAKAFLASPPKDLPASGEEKSCPDGHRGLCLVEVLSVPALFCPVCRGILLRNEDALKKLADKEGGASPIAVTLYVLSLPERVGRTTVGSAAGLVKELAETLLPGLFKRTRLYNLTVQKSLRFLIEEVGEIEGAYKKEVERAAPENYVVKKALGNAVDIASLAVLHVSPAFALAVLSDCAFGVRTYLKELAQELEKLGVLGKAKSIETVDDLLSVLERSSGTLADSLDTPPISVEELKGTVREVRKALKDPNTSLSVKPEAVEGLWQEMKALAKKERRSLLNISSVAAMRVFSSFPKLGLGIYGSAKAAYNLINGEILTYYKEAFQELRREGWIETLKKNYQPYAKALGKAFSPKKKSITERLFSKQSPLLGLFKAVLKFFRRKKGSKLEA